MSAFYTRHFESVCVISSWYGNGCWSHLRVQRNFLGKPIFPAASLILCFNIPNPVPRPDDAGQELPEEPKKSGKIGLPMFGRYGVNEL